MERQTMDNQTNLNSNTHKAHIQEAASELLDESIKYAHELYDDGLKRVGIAQKEAEIYKDELLEQVREHPLKAVLIAGGVGFLLSALLRK